jgi:spermidine synthase
MIGPAKAVWLLVPLFAASGCAALIYEVVWLQLLQLVVGSSAVSLTVLLGTFMGGMCLGSLLVPWIVNERLHPLRVFAWLEGAIAGSGALILVLMPLVTSVYISTGGHVAVRILVASLCLLPPTIAMGATLVTVAGGIDPSRTGMSKVGFIYAGNLAGAVTGSLLAGFYLLRVFDVYVATFVAATLNLATAAVALRLARAVNDSPDDRSMASARGRTRVPPVDSRFPLGIYTSIALSGLTALSAQVIWTRFLALSFGATVYTFSLVLAAILVGLGAGSAIGGFIETRTRADPRIALGCCQMLIAVAITWASFVSLDAIPFGVLSPLASTSPWETFRWDFFRALVAVLPATLLWGASFPFGLASLALNGTDTRRMVSMAYAANTLGAIVGSVGTGLLLANSVGSHVVQQILILVAGVSGALVLMARTHVEIRYTWWVAIGVGLAVLAYSLTPLPGPLVAYGRRTRDWLQTTRVADTGEIVFVGEGAKEFVAVSRGANGDLTYHVEGKVQASTLPPDMRLQLLLAHLSHLLPARPAEVLVIGCGAGITAGALAMGPGVGHVTIAEIEPLVPKVAAQFFGDFNHHVMRDPRVSLRIDDGRHVLATSTKMFDVITTDLTDPWVKGVAALFTEEFFELAKRRLRPGGIVTQFVQLYQSSPEAVKSEIATFFKVFPNAVVWGNPQEGEGYDLVLVGQADPIRIDIDALQRRLDQPSYRGVRESLQTVGIGSTIDLLSRYVASGADLSTWLRDASINRDRDLRLQYLAGVGLDLDENRGIYDDLVRHGTFPSGTFTGSPERLQQLRSAFESNRR